MLGRIFLKGFGAKCKKKVLVQTQSGRKGLSIIFFFSLYLNQYNYVNKVMSRFYMHTAEPVVTPLGNHDKLSLKQCPTNAAEWKHMSQVPYASAVGSLMYTMVCYRPDLAHSMSVVSRYMSCAGKTHWKSVKWILRYLKGTTNHGLKFEKGFTGEQAFIGYVDSDFAANQDNRKSLTGYVFTLFGTTISWKAV